MRRADDQNIGNSATPGHDGFCLHNEALHAHGDAGGAHTETLLGVVGAEHDDQQIHRLMAHEGGIDDVQAGHALVKRVGKDGGTAGEALLNHQTVLAERLLQQAGPALVLVKAVASVGTVGGIGAVTVGIGISKAYDMFLHNQTSGSEAATAD